MQVVILAGGLGVRLRPVTLTVPKPMVLVNSKPFLEYQIALVRDQGFDDVVLLIGHLGEQIEAHFQDGRDWRIRIRYSYETRPLGTAGAIVNAQTLLEPEFLLLNGDTYLGTDYCGMLQLRNHHDELAVMAVYANHDQIAPNNVTVAENGRVTQYTKNPGIGLTHVDAGAYAISRRLLELLTSGPSSLEGDVFPMLVRDGRLLAWPVSERFYDIGTFERLELAHRILS